MLEASRRITQFASSYLSGDGPAALGALDFDLKVFFQFTREVATTLGASVSFSATVDAAFKNVPVHRL